MPRRWAFWNYSIVDGRISPYLDKPTGEDILVDDPLTVLVHHASFKHRGCALPVQIDPTWYVGFGHSVAPADAFGHFSG